MSFISSNLFNLFDKKSSKRIENNFIEIQACQAEMKEAWNCSITLFVHLSFKIKFLFFSAYETHFVNHI